MAIQSSTSLTFVEQAMSFNDHATRPLLGRNSSHQLAFLLLLLLAFPTTTTCFVLHRPSPPQDVAIRRWMNSEAAFTESSFHKISPGIEPRPPPRISSNRRRRHYERKRIPETERELKSLKVKRQQQYERLLASGSTSLWSFESLFPNPVWDEESIEKDLFGVRDRDRQTSLESQGKAQRMRSTRAPSLFRATQQQQNEGIPICLASNVQKHESGNGTPWIGSSVSQTGMVGQGAKATEPKLFQFISNSFRRWNVTTGVSSSGSPVDRDMTRLVEDRMYGYRRDPEGGLFYDTSLVGDGAVQFRNGVRLGNPIKLNADRLNYLAKKELQHGRVEEAVELLERAVQIDARDGRAYLGLSRCAQRRGDFQLAREYLKVGITNSYEAQGPRKETGRGANPYLTQALGCLEEKAGHLALAEELYLKSIKSRPSHAAAWVSLAQLRTLKLGQPVAAGRSCFQNAERELKKAGRSPSSYVYTAWAAMEYKKAGDTKRARELFKAALAVDPKCSAAWLQLGVMEADKENWKEAQLCFETVLKFDQRNSRVLQAYALMETKRPEGSSRKAIDFFERALRSNTRDAAVYQAYALYVAELGDIDAARDLLQRATQVDKRHAPVWQAWGVLETRHGTAAAARRVFQQGIWACAQPTGNQSGGYRCARLWQAWGVLETREGDFAAARRCFSRALDADKRNVPAITAWALMEESQQNVQDARCIFERTLPNFSAGSDAKICLWRTYELLEQRLGNVSLAQQVYQRAMREALMVSDDTQVQSGEDESAEEQEEEVQVEPPNEVEVVRWNGGGGEVWLNMGAIEMKVPFDMRKRSANN
jgi:Tfp pilus assembly protein PilF